MRTYHEIFFSRSDSCCVEVKESRFIFCLRYTRLPPKKESKYYVHHPFIRKLICGHHRHIFATNSILSRNHVTIISASLISGGFFMRSSPSLVFSFAIYFSYLKKVDEDDWVFALCMHALYTANQFLFLFRVTKIFLLPLMYYYAPCTKKENSPLDFSTCLCVCVCVQVSDTWQGETRCFKNIVPSCVRGISWDYVFFSGGSSSSYVYIRGYSFIKNIITCAFWLVEICVIFTIEEMKFLLPKKINHKAYIKPFCYLVSFEEYRL